MPGVEKRGEKEKGKIELRVDHIELTQLLLMVETSV